MIWLQLPILLLAAAAACAHNRDRTNARWLRWATRTKPGCEECRAWWHRPLWQRGLAQGAAVVLAAETLLGLLTARGLTIALLAVTVLAGCACAGCRAWRALQPHHRDIVRPTRDALADHAIVGITPWKLTVAPDLSRVELPLPYGYVAHEHERKAIVTTVNTKVPGAEPLFPDWSGLHGRKPRVVLTRIQPPPLKVTFSDIRTQVEAAEDHEVILGLGSGGKPYKRSLATETPHLLVCMPTGDGKSKCVMNLAAQCLYHGWLGIVLDYKMLSHSWADDLPNVCYAWTTAMIHDALMWLASDEYQESELTYRKKIGKAHHDVYGNVTADVGPRIFVICEEMNATMRKLKRYWRGLPGAKGPSPACDALDEMGETGRQFGFSLWYVAQAASAGAISASGKADAKENIGLGVFGGGTSRRTWDLCTDGHAFPQPSTHKGRYNVVYRQSVDAIQSPYELGVAEQQARDFAVAGIVAQPHRDLPFTRRVGSVPGHVIGGQGVPGAPEQPVVLGHGTRQAHLRTIRQAMASGWFDGVDVEALRQRVKRAKKKGTLKGQGWDGSSELFDQDELKDLVR